MKCRECLIWQNMREKYNTPSLWDRTAHYGLGCLKTLATMIPRIKQEWGKFEILGFEECPQGRSCLLNEKTVSWFQNSL